MTEALPSAVEIAREPAGQLAWRLAAVAAIGDLGDAESETALAALASSPESAQLRVALDRARQRIKDRHKGKDGG